MIEPLDTWEKMKNLSEIIKNLLEALAVIGGVAALWKWLVERKDRATDILLKLETEFRDDKVMRGRLCIEDDRLYNSIKERLKRYVAESRNATQAQQSPSAMEIKVESPEETTGRSDDFQAVDALLRFYVVLCGVRQAKQVPERSLSTCFRFWLGHYYHPKRPEFTAYVDAYFPTLKAWLACDKEGGHKFFCPEHFGWPTT
jgi:hypothetical protein